MAIDTDTHDVSTSHTDIWWDAATQVVWCVMRVDPHEGDHARENIEGVMRLREKLGRTKLRVLVDIRQLRTVSRPARAFYASQYTASVARAVALVTGDNIGRILANFFLGLNSPLHPLRLFDAPEAAIAWLGEFSAD